jgi:hypothetical protein
MTSVFQLADEPSKTLETYCVRNAMRKKPATPKPDSGGPETPAPKTDPLRARLEARNAAIDSNLVNIAQRMQQLQDEFNRLEAVRQELSVEKTENLKALGAGC